MKNSFCALGLEMTIKKIINKIYKYILIWFLNIYFISVYTHTHTVIFHVEVFELCRTDMQKTITYISDLFCLSNKYTTQCFINIWLLCIVFKWMHIYFLYFVICIFILFTLFNCIILGCNLNCYAVRIKCLHLSVDWRFVNWYW